MNGRAIFRLLLDAAAGDGKGGGGSGGGGSGGGSPADIQAEVRRQVNERNGDALGLAGALMAENHRLKTDLDAASKKLPAADAVVLTKAEAERWEAYKKLGKPEDIGKTISEHATLKRSESIREAAEAGGYKPGPLGKLVPADAELSIKAGKNEKGEATRTPEITVGGKTQALSAYLEAEHGDFLPVVKADGKAAEEKPRPKGTPPPRDDSRERPRPGEATEKEFDPRADLLANPAYGSLIG